MSNQGYWMMDDGNSTHPQQQQQGDWYTAETQSNTPYNAEQWQASGGFHGDPSNSAMAAPTQDFYSSQQPQYAAFAQPQAAADTQQYSGQMFYPSSLTEPHKSGALYDDEDELPLMEELGINFDHIRQKTLAVLNPLKEAPAQVIQDQDLAGPLAFCLLFGGALLLHGKVHFGFIYGIGVIGCVAMYGLLNLMAAESISLTCTVSVLGYCLLPMALLSLSAALLSFQGLLGYGISSMAVLWCSASASKLFVTALAMDHQRLLVAYPCTLVYAVFALLAIF